MWYNWKLKLNTVIITFRYLLPGCPGFYQTAISLNNIEGKCCERYLDVICLQSLIQDIQGIINPRLKIWVTTLMTLCLLNRISLVIFFCLLFLLLFPHLLLLSMYHFVQTNLHCSVFNADWDGFHQ